MKGRGEPVLMAPAHRARQGTVGEGALPLLRPDRESSFSLKKIMRSIRGGMKFGFIPSSTY